MSDFVPIKNKEIHILKPLGEEIFPYLRSIRDQAKESDLIALPNWLVMAMCNTLIEYIVVNKVEYKEVDK